MLSGGQSQAGVQLSSRASVIQSDKLDGNKKQFPEWMVMVIVQGNDESFLLSKEERRKYI